ncbi:MAG: GtrA family protein [Kiritimatiellia bacterium]
MRRHFAGLPPWRDVKGWLRAILSRDPHPLLQFIRYGVAGGLAMVANVLFFAVCIEWVFPIPEGADPETVTASFQWGELGPWLRDLGRDPRVANFVKANAAAFLAANAVAYVLNFKWVFESGRHSRGLEITLFLTVSFISFLLGTALASVMVGSYGMNEYVAKAGDVVAAILINYVCRKFLIFKQ